MSIILNVWSNNPFNNGGCDFAVVELTPELAKLALRRIAALCEQKSLDPCVCETYYWGSEAEYFSPWIDSASQSADTNTACPDLEKLLEEFKADRREMVVSADKVTLLENQIAHVECGQMIVREDSTSFTAIPKHTDFYVTTAEIPKDVVQRAATSLPN